MPPLTVLAVVTGFGPALSGLVAGFRKRDGRAGGFGLGGESEVVAAAVRRPTDGEPMATLRFPAAIFMISCVIGFSLIMVCIFLLRTSARRA